MGYTLFIFLFFYFSEYKESIYFGVVNTLFIFIFSYYFSQFKFACEFASTPTPLAEKLFVVRNTFSGQAAKTGL